jgi:multicomponent Na+:H+ antiporter subunit C
MEIILAIVSGLLFACSFYLMMRRNLLRFIIGFIILSNAVNLLIFTMGRLTLGQPPLVHHHGAEVPPAPYANPLPQALILTAIVISFGLLAFTLVLVYRNYTVARTIDADELSAAEHPPSPLPVADDAPPRLPA